MASASIRRRKTRSGEARFQVRYRLGGRGYPLVHGGTFGTLKEARIRRDFVAGELAAGRNPAEALRSLLEAPRRRTFAQWATAYETSRVDFAVQTAKNVKSHMKRLLPSFGDRDPATIMPADVKEWVAANSDLKSAKSQALHGNAAADP